MHKLLSRFSLFCLLSLAYSSHVVAFGDDNYDLFGYPNYGRTNSYDDASGVGFSSDDDRNDELGILPQDKSDDFKSLFSLPEHNPSSRVLVLPVKKGGEINNGATEHAVLSDSMFPEVPKHEFNSTDQNMFVRWWQESTSGQIWGLAGIVAILGYSVHLLYAWYKKCNATLPTITEYDYQVAKTLLEAMRDDMKQLKSGSKKLPRVNLVDFSKMTPEFVAECQMLVAMFMNMYKTCREDAKNMVMLETFYSNVADAMQSLEDRVEQSNESETLVVTHEDEA